MFLLALVHACCFSAVFFHDAAAQGSSPDALSPPVAQPQLNTYNANEPEPARQGQISLGPGIDYASAQAIQVARDFERSNWAGYSVYDDPFYKLPTGPISKDPGRLLKKQETVNISSYTIPPELALSRILYNTQNLNGSVIPASAFVLWPYIPRNFPGIQGHPVVGFGHGTTGINAECAPSHLQNLWYQFHATFPLAIHGYVVVAPDYAGLGVDTDSDGNHIFHQWSANPAGANDLAYAIQAAQEAWPELSKEFVTFGHSEGGGIAWSMAQRQVKQPVEGYLGSIAASPLNRVAVYGQLSLSMAQRIAQGPIFIASALASVFPTFRVDDWLTPAGLNILKTDLAIQGCQAVGAELFFTPGIDYLKQDWAQDWYLDAYDKLMSNGGDVPFAGPLLVLQGTSDMTIDPTITTSVVNETCETQPDSDLEYVMLEGVDHIPVLYAAQSYWSEWISQRFNRIQTSKGCRRQTIKPLRPVDHYQPELHFFTEFPLYSYETN